MIDFSHLGPDDDATLDGAKMSLLKAVWKAMDVLEAAGEYEARLGASLAGKEGAEASTMVAPHFPPTILIERPPYELGPSDVRRLAAMPAFQKQASGHFH
jgi:hypothetical protein